MNEPLQNAGLFKRLAACTYELFLLIALWLVFTAIFTWIIGNTDTWLNRLLLQIFLWLVTGAYFIWCWSRSGQTLAAQTWKIKLVNNRDFPPNFRQSLSRYVLATLSFSLLGLGFFWACIDSDRFFLHDRILGTRLVSADKKAKTVKA